MCSKRETNGQRRPPVLRSTGPLATHSTRKRVVGHVTNKKLSCTGRCWQTSSRQGDAQGPREYLRTLLVREEEVEYKPTSRTLLPTEAWLPSVSSAALMRHCRPTISCSYFQFRYDIVDTNVNKMRRAPIKYNAIILTSVSD